MVFTKELSGLRNLAERMVKLLEYELFGAINALRSKGVRKNNYQNILEIQLYCLTVVGFGRELYIFKKISSTARRNLEKSKSSSFSSNLLIS